MCASVAVPRTPLKMCTIAPKSCDTFVVLPDKTEGGVVVFGKNSDRPAGEVQEVIYYPAADHTVTRIECTFITVSQVPHTEAVLISKPSWMWGAEMGANGKGVCVGNEAIWTKALDGKDEKVERLLGMDMVRLSLERSSTAEEAITVISELLEKYGQGGPCSDTEPGLIYHNSFLAADPTEAWVLETAGKLWVAEKITEGFRNISNCLSIGTKFDKSSANIEKVCKEMGWWDGEGVFSFAKALSPGGEGSTSRKVWGENLLQDLTKHSQFGLRSMLQVLRDDRSGICMGDGTTGSQASVLSPPGSRNGPSCHWLTGTPDPQRSVFKPFVFTPKARLSLHIKSPTIDRDPAKMKPRFERVVNRAHLLYKRHRAALAAGKVTGTLRKLEEQCIDETTKTLAAHGEEALIEMHDIFKDCVDSELKFYK